MCKATMRPCVATLLALWAVAAHSTSAQEAASNTATVSSALALKLAMDASIAHIVITEHLDLSDLPAVPLGAQNYADSEVLLMPGIHFQTMRVRSAVHALTMPCKTDGLAGMHLSDTHESKNRHSCAICSSLCTCCGKMIVACYPESQKIPSQHLVAKGALLGH